MAAEAGQLQLNAFEPIIVKSLSEGMAHLGAACRTVATRCVDGITANADLLRERVENSIGLVTALSPYLGYVESTTIAQEALVSGRNVVDLVLEKKLLAREELDRLLSPQHLANLRVAPAPHADAPETSTR
jgi:aspartate ammonia-lyase